MDLETLQALQEKRKMQKMRTNVSFYKLIMQESNTIKASEKQMFQTSVLFCNQLILNSTPPT